MRARVAALAAFGAGGIVAAILLLAQGDPIAGAAAASTSTATIKRQDLVETDTADGTLGYGDTRKLSNRLRGIVTWLPPTGRVIRLDRTLYKVDDSPVVLMNGRVPMYRALGPGMPDGADVRQLEGSLRAAGFDRRRELAVDRAWDAATTAAVKRWQQAHGLARTGSIELGRIVFLPGRRRVATIGEQKAGVLITTTSTRRQVTVALDTAKSTLARKGARVTVELPSGEQVGGRIASVGTVATARPAEDPSADLKATIEVKIRLLSANTSLDQAPVTVRFERSRRRDVLAIPVTALVAQPGGRFAVQLVRGGATRVVPVRPGLYASGYVEIAGSGLRPGQRVTNAAVR